MCACCVLFLQISTLTALNIHPGPCNRSILSLSIRATFRNLNLQFITTAKISQQPTNQPTNQPNQPTNNQPNNYSSAINKNVLIANSSASLLSVNKVVSSSFSLPQVIRPTNQPTNQSNQPPFYNHTKQQSSKAIPIA